MTTPETWWVVLESGEVREVLVKREPRAWTARAASGAEGASGVSARRAVQLLAMAPEWPVREILAPGEVSRAEEVAALRERIDELSEEAQMACQEPDDDCQCAGCRYAAEVYGDEPVEVPA